MDDETARQEVGKPRKRPATKATAKPAASKVKTTLTLNVETYQRLSVHATMAGMTLSEMGEKLINDNLRRWVVSDRGGPDEEAVA